MAELLVDQLSILSLDNWTSYQLDVHVSKLKSTLIHENNFEKCWPELHLEILYMCWALGTIVHSEKQSESRELFDSVIGQSTVILQIPAAKIEPNPKT